MDDARARVLEEVLEGKGTREARGAEGHRERQTGPTAAHAGETSTARARIIPLERGPRTSEIGEDRTAADRRPARLLRHRPRRLPRLRAPAGPRAGRRWRASSIARCGTTRSWTSSRSAASSTSAAISSTSRRAAGASPGSSDDDRRGPRRDAPPGRRRDRSRHAPRRRRHLPGVLLRRPLARLRRLPPPGRDAERPRPVELRDRGHQARPAHEGERAAPDLLVRRPADAAPGHEPEWMHVALGGSARDGRAPPRRRLHGLLPPRPAPLRGDGRRNRRRPTRPPTTYPEPVEHCDVCRWDEICTKRRRAATTTCRSLPASRPASAGR